MNTYMVRSSFHDDIIPLERICLPVLQGRLAKGCFSCRAMAIDEVPHIRLSYVPACSLATLATDNN